MPRLQTFDGPELDAVLARVRKEAGPEARIASATKVRAGGVGGFFTKEKFKVTVEVPDPVDAPAPVAEAAPEVELDEPAPSSLFELVDLVDEAELEVHVAERPVPQPQPEPVPAPPPAPVAVAVREPAPVPSTELPSFQSVLRRITAEATGEPLTMPVPAPLAAPVPALLDPDALGRLAHLGIPDDVLPTALTPEAAVIALIHSLRIPVAPPVPTEDGALTVIVGEKKVAAAVAAELAAEAGVTKRNVLIADTTPAGKALRLVDPDDARARRATWRQGPRFVALTAPAGQSLGWAWDMLAALEPTALWGVTAADRKCEDVDAWSAALGGFDALALHDLDATVSPASMLQLGIPIARLDGQPASASLWASILTARVAA